MNRLQSNFFYFVLFTVILDFSFGLNNFSLHFFSITSSSLTLTSSGFNKFKILQDQSNIKVTSSPESGMMIFINGKSTGKTTPSTIELLTPGDYSVLLTGQWYKAQEKKVTVNAGETVDVDFEMVQNYAEITINTNFDGAIYVDGIRKGTTTWTGRVQEGNRSFSVDKEGMISREHKALITRGKGMQIDLMMKLKTGGLVIETEPAGAMIDIGGRMYGLTPTTITELLPGEYNVVLSKPGYTGITKRVKIVDDQSTTLEVRLYKGKEIIINTEPSGAQVYIGDSLLGVTPLKALMDFGESIVKITKGDFSTVETIVVNPSGQSAFNIKLKETNDPFESQMVFVKGGTFTMGDTFGDGKKEEKPTHTVTVKDFYISKNEITQNQWENLMGSNPSHFAGCGNCPVERVNWDEVQEFIVKLNLLTGKKYRLPTEAEWEYAARGGSLSKGYRYSGSNNINNVAWYTVNSSNKTQPVGQFPPNELGLYDMSGNVWEWCNDWMANYSSKSESNPQGPETGELRVVRGGSWFGYIGGNRVSARGADDPANGRSYLGFRLALTP